MSWCTQSNVEIFVSQSNEKCICCDKFHQICKGSAINVIIVDYGPLARENCYPQAVSNSLAISQCVAKFIDTLLTFRTELKLYDFHFIGFSMGCHVLGQMKEHLKSGQMERLTALDAAMPLFYFPKKNGQRRLNLGDAKFIDVLHTNAGVFGARHPLGNLDFYANDGSVQPGCGKNVTCSHSRAVELYSASINPENKFMGHNRDHKRDKQLFGEYVDYGATGTFHFDTSEKLPFFRRAND